MRHNNREEKVATEDKEAGRKHPNLMTQLAYEPATRVLSVSFQRNPEEYADLLIASQDRQRAAMLPAYGWPLLVGTCLLGGAMGIGMELYRRYLLVPLLEPAAVPPLNVLLLEFLPFILLIVGIFYGRRHYLRHFRRRKIMSGSDARQIVDIDIFLDGIVMSTGGLVSRIDWSAIPRPEVVGDRLQFGDDRLLAYLPERAFASRRDFEAAAAQAEEFWQRARLRAQAEPPALKEIPKRAARG